MSESLTQEQRDEIENLALHICIGAERLGADKVRELAPKDTFKFYHAEPRYSEGQNRGYFRFGPLEVVFEYAYCLPHEDRRGMYGAKIEYNQAMVTPLKCECKIDEIAHLHDSVETVTKRGWFGREKTETIHTRYREIISRWGVKEGPWNEYLLKQLTDLRRWTEDVDNALRVNWENIQDQEKLRKEASQRAWEEKEAQETNHVRAFYDLENDL